MYVFRRTGKKRRSKSSSTGYGGSAHDVCVLINEIDDEYIHTYDELYFRESSSVTSPAEYKIYIYRTRRTRDKIDDESSLFFLLVCIYRYCLTDHKFLSLFILNR